MHSRSLPFVFVVSVFSMLPTVVCAEDKLDPAQVEFFEQRIRPVLVEHCDSCHSSKSKSVKGGLRLDSRDAARAGGDSGPAVIPGKPDESLLLSALKYDGLEMPPKGRLSPKIIADFETWIRTGAADPRTANAPAKKPAAIDYSAGLKFWAFQPPKKHKPPAVDDADIRNDIDRFVRAKLEAAGLAPNDQADRHALLRRVYFDLIGLPPTPEEIEAYVSDSSPNAFETVVDRLLDSPHYGERWGRHWLDVARYGEDQAHTFKARRYPRGYYYRDWVVNALNSDMPYNEFVMAQIAGDLLDESTKHERMAALGLFALGPVYYAENVEKAKATADEWDDRIDTLTRGVLGLTVSCARCHDHKYDPISMQDYYGLAGIFASTQYQERPIVSSEIVAARRAADRSANEHQLSIDRFLATETKKIRPALTVEIPRYLIATWKLINRRKRSSEKKKTLKEIAKNEKVSEALLNRWMGFLAKPKGKSKDEQEWLADWFDLLKTQDANDDLSKDEQAVAAVREVAAALQKRVESKLDRRHRLFSQFGESVAFVKDGDRAVVQPGIIPLGNLFDDSTSTSLDSALASDRFKAVATADSLGVDRVVKGWGEETRIADGIGFHFGKLGADTSAFGEVTNDGWNTSGGISTTGKRVPESGGRMEQGIGMHANLLVTFDLDEIRRAGLLPPDQKFVFKVDRAGINDDSLGANSSANLAVIVSRPPTDKATSDAIIAGYVNGQQIEQIDVADFTYYFNAELPEPIKADGRFVSFDVPIPAEAKFLTLATCGAGEPDSNSINSDHTVFSGARLEMNPLPKTKLAGRSRTPASESSAEDDRRDAILLSRFLYDEGLLALAPNEAESHLPKEPRVRLVSLREEQKQLKASAEKIAVPQAHSLTEGKSQDLPVYLAGNPAKQGDVALRALPAIFTQGDRDPFKPQGSGRLELARAVASAGNPLTARVMVNRVWAAHFGHGLVRTTSNFGQLGERPSHPELLDWLAVRFVEQGWSLKQLHRDILLSATWQQSSDINRENQEVDPENRLLWRMNRRRLEVEPWRDSMLAVTGELDASRGGPSLNLDDANNKRRTLYGFVSRHRLNELLRLFDFPDPNITSASRSVTTVPLQQLFVLNSDFMARRARALAKRLSELDVSDSESRVRYAYQLIYGRSAAAEELATAVSFLEAVPTSGESSKDQLGRWEQYAMALLSANEFLFVD